jgi:hypothetical protein
MTFDQWRNTVDQDIKHFLYQHEWAVTMCKEVWDTSAANSQEQIDRLETLVDSYTEELTELKDKILQANPNWKQEE